VQALGTTVFVLLLHPYFYSTLLGEAIATNCWTHCCSQAALPWSRKCVACDLQGRITCMLKSKQLLKDSTRHLGDGNCSHAYCFVLPAAHPNPFSTFTSVLVDPPPLSTLYCSLHLPPFPLPTNKACHSHPRPTTAKPCQTCPLCPPCHPKWEVGAFFGSTWVAFGSTLHVLDNSTRGRWVRGQLRLRDA